MAGTEDHQRQGSSEQDLDEHRRERVNRHRGKGEARASD
jgi:hypothetical protein